MAKFNKKNVRSMFIRVLRDIELCNDREGITQNLLMVMPLKYLKI